MSATVEQLISRIVVEGDGQYVSKMKNVERQSEATAGKMLKVGAGLTAVGAAGTAFSASALRASMNMERERKSLEVLGGSARFAADELSRLDKRASVSAFDFTELVSASKLLKAWKLDSREVLTATEDLAAGMNAPLEQVARAFGRIRAGDGEGFEALRDLGIGFDDLKAKGLKFTKSNEYVGDSLSALAAVLQIVQERFGGLSQTIARDTTSGALSNLSDQWGRLQRAAGDRALPIIRQALVRASDALGDFVEGMSPAQATMIAFAGPAATVAGSLTSGAALFMQYRSATLLSAAATQLHTQATVANAGAIAAQGVAATRTSTIMATLGKLGGAAAIGIGGKMLGDQFDASTPGGYAGKFGSYTAGGAAAGAFMGGGLPGAAIGGALGAGYAAWDEWQSIGNERDRANKSGAEADARRGALKQGGKSWLRSQFGGQTPREAAMAAGGGGGSATGGSFADVIDAFKSALMGGIGSGAFDQPQAFMDTGTGYTPYAAQSKAFAASQMANKPQYDWTRMAFGGGGLASMGVTPQELGPSRLTSGKPNGGAIPAKIEIIVKDGTDDFKAQVLEVLLSLARQGYK